MRTSSLLLALALATGCAKSAPAPKAPPVADPIPMAEPASASTAPAASVAVLGAYERVRVLLAADEMSGVGDAATSLVDAARAAATETGTSHFMAIAHGAGKLAEATDIAVARSVFGEISQHLVALLAQDKALASGQHVFECSMATGYNKWVQPTKQLENPYMGKKMLTCGGESTWQ